MTVSRPSSVCFQNRDAIDVHDKNRYLIEIATFDLTLIGSVLNIVTGLDTCNARSALWINPSLCTVSLVHNRECISICVCWSDNIFFCFYTTCHPPSTGTDRGSIQVQRNKSSLVALLRACRSITGRKSHGGERQVYDAWFHFAMGDDRWQSSISVDAVYGFG